YRLTLDGKTFETEGIMCLIANSGYIGQTGLKFAPTIDVSDGLLDVIVIRKGDLGSLLTVAATLMTRAENGEPLLHCQAREMVLDPAPPQPVQVDGELFGKPPFTAKVLPQAARIVVPKSPASPQST